MQDQVSTDPTFSDQSNYDWQPCILRVPRLAKIVSREGLKTRLLWPGAYIVRRSRSMKCLIYRRATP